MNTGSWSEKEQARFVAGLERYGRNYEKVAEHVQTRTLQSVLRHTKVGDHSNLPIESFCCVF
jgi:hypothetical protein